MTERERHVTPWLAADQIEDWKALVGLMTTLPAVLDAQLKRDAGLTLFEYHLLVALSGRPAGEIPMSDLARMIQSSPSRLSHAVARLERAGWVERTECAAAGKRTGARLTQEGRDQLRRAAPGHVREVRRLVVDALDPAHLRALGDAARTVVGLADPEVAALLARPESPDPATPTA